MNVVGPSSVFPPGYCLINFGGHPFFFLGPFSCILGSCRYITSHLSLTSARIKKLAFRVLLIHDVSSCKFLAVVFLCGRVRLGRGVSADTGAMANINASGVI